MLETDDGEHAHEMIGQNVELSVSSLTAQIVET